MFIKRKYIFGHIPQNGKHYTQENRLVDNSIRNLSKTALTKTTVWPKDDLIGEQVFSKTNAGTRYVFYTGESFGARLGPPVCAMRIVPFFRLQVVNQILLKRS